jgi:hypothetical protein
MDVISVKALQVRVCPSAPCRLGGGCPHRRRWRSVRATLDL